MRNITPEDLVQYLYSETSPEKTAAIKAALEADLKLREDYEVMAAAKKQLEDIELQPRDEVVKRILKNEEKLINQLYPH
jgi:hypothetical protein